MPLSLTSRELFKSWQNSLSCLIPRLQGKPFNRNLVEKNWVDTFLYENPAFIGKRTIKSPQGLEIAVTYGKNFVTYPYAYQVINEQYVVEELIISRDDAILLNIHRGDEGTADATNQASKVGVFNDIPWDRPLADNEVIKRLTPFSSPQIFSADELISSGEQIMNDTIVRLARIESKLDNLVTLIK